MIKKEIYGQRMFNISSVIMDLLFNKTQGYQFYVFKNCKYDKQPREFPWKDNVISFQGKKTSNHLSFMVQKLLNR